MKKFVHFRKTLLISKVFSRITANLKNDFLFPKNEQTFSYKGPLKKQTVKDFSKYFSYMPATTDSSLFLGWSNFDNEFFFFLFIWSWWSTSNEQYELNEQLSCKFFWFGFVWSFINIFFFVVLFCVHILLAWVNLLQILVGQSLGGGDSGINT